VAERLNRPADAERWYRRAYGIASGVLQPDHPFVVMSAKNLKDFCDARGIPFERAAAVAPVAPAAAVDPQPKASWLPRKADAPLAAPAAAAPSPAAPRPAPHRPAPAQPKRDPVPAAAPPPAVEPTSSPRFLVIAAIVLVALIAGGVWTIMSSRTARQEPAATAPSASAPAPTPAEPPPAQPASREPPAAAAATSAAEQASQTPPAAAPVDPQPQPQPTESSPPKAAPKQARSADAAATLVSAQLCRPLTLKGSWNCTPASDRVAAGVVFYYTKVSCPADTTIEHRWYFNDRLLQSVPLRVRANNSGYRTYSRTTIGPERAGNWRVELLAADGTVLHEERFSVTR
jgi:hypothetical protein